MVRLEAELSATRQVLRDVAGWQPKQSENAKCGRYPCAAWGVESLAERGRSTARECGRIAVGQFCAMAKVGLLDVPNATSMGAGVPKFKICVRLSAGFERRN